MQQDRQLRDKYYSLIRGFPALVQSVGIAQALAFVMSKAADEQAPRQLRDHLTGWLFSPHCPVPWSHPVQNYQGDREGGLMRRLLDETDPEVWWYAEEEAVAFSIWLKRFAEAITQA
jgi:CRISPR type III-B/RAMP module-associated protein Cmr5